MDKKEIRFSILTDPMEIKVSKSEKERIFDMSRRMYEDKKHAAAVHTEPADEVSGVEVYHRPGWQRAVSAAAVLAIAAAGVGGSVFMVNSVKENTIHPATQIEDGLETLPAMEKIAVTEPVSDRMTYDMSTKEGIYHKMLDSIDFFDRASGRYIYNTDTDYRLVDFSLNLVTGEYYNTNTIITLSNPAEVLSGMPADTDGKPDGYIYYSDGTKHYMIDTNRNEATAAPGTPAKREGAPITAEGLDAVRDWFFAHNEDDERYYDTDMYRNSAAGESTYGYEGQLLAVYYLTDFGAWEITREETFNGRDCVVIDGHVTKACWFSEGEATFELCVDKETGYAVKYASYDEGGMLMDFYVYEALYFDDDAEMMTVDLGQYTMYEIPGAEEPERSDADSIDDVADADVPAQNAEETAGQPESQNVWDVNSKGETYGVAGSIRLEEKNIDRLPDLTEIGLDGGRRSGYIRTREFLDTFVDAEKAFFMQPPHGEVTDTAVPVEVSIYDQEGEFLCTLILYNEPENLRPVASE